MTENSYIAKLTKAAERGNTEAQYKLGVFYETGNGVEIDLEKANYWYTRYVKDSTKGNINSCIKCADELGNADAQYNIGRHFEHGVFIKKTPSQAFYWFSKAAEQGHVKAQESLASCYQYGMGVSVDISKANYWFTKAAEQGDSRAQYELGECYQFGKGVEMDLDKAIEWYTKAAEHKDPLCT